jgi:hypothetical protein
MDQADAEGIMVIDESPAVNLRSGFWPMEWETTSKILARLQESDFFHVIHVIKIIFFKMIEFFIKISNYQIVTHAVTAIDILIFI